ncbi:hypothetical protein V9T40_008265 [Parthenolecanium corni]|uniref:Uncharacterized protein n=1 Tax=Parthenolecanium corni TaxID=536013 RepID=A0AAN9TY57_9HEMI
MRSGCVGGCGGHYGSGLKARPRLIRDARGRQCAEFRNVIEERLSRFEPVGRGRGRDAMAIELIKNWSANG